MKTLNNILDIIAIIIVVAMIIAFAILVYWLHAFVTIFIEINWWEYVLVALVGVFCIWRIWRM